jgi:hypothetical protein
VRSAISKKYIKGEVAGQLKSIHKIIKPETNIRGIT